MSRVTPRLMAAVGPLPMIVTGAIGLTVSFVWLSTLTAGDGYASGVFGPMLLNGLSAGLLFMPVTSIVLGGVEPEHAGAASGLLQTFQQLGGAVGLAVIVSVYAAGAVPGVVPPRRPGGVPHLGDDGRPGRGRRAGRAGQPPAYAGPRGGRRRGRPGGAAA